ncbi:hypothetical protein [Staphylococcus phage SA3]|uniref:Uncharacterized protein n=8 Tax=Kayvirus TaxID=1857843 RepID=A0A3Q9R5D6_9CAUD|nr:hypothetical protein F360_gp196 [Staphylococcus phage G15]YP_009099434.1 hypothetical protein P108_0097 [Staphylococcus phage P108]ARQ96168.1 hypothetical protein qdsa002_212 [Staphylococcus phage qdsa002]ASZ78117.1 hypothetical protein [Staphylococcus phage SA3]AUG85620.1 hypothetical protein HSA30_gp116 [Staphylococcus phage HSA30]AXU40144.1 hypothetical protein VBSavMJYL01_142 [Staphylococcus phage VB_SavM_JYL01]AZU97550.1 hypothetical protein VBSavMJYL02_138 [Staphylococcus phage VB-Sa
MNNKQIERLHKKANEVVSKSEDIEDLGYVQAHKIIKGYLDLPVSDFEKRDVMTELLLALDKANKSID